MLGSLTQPHIWTANLLVIGLVQGLIVSLIAMGIVLVYRSSRVINFAVGDLGVPAAAVLAVDGRQDRTGRTGPACSSRCSSARSPGTVVEIAVIRRLAKAPRVIVLVATIGIAELCQAVVHALPDYRTGQLQIAYPSPMTSQWTITSFGFGPFHVHDITITGPAAPRDHRRAAHHARAVVAARPHPLRRGGAATATNADLARLTGVSPKIMSTAIWTIAGFLSTVSVILYATAQGSARSSCRSGPRRCCSACRPRSSRG